MPKYLAEIILVGNVKDLEEARKIADYLIDLPIPDKNIKDKIEIMRESLLLLIDFQAEVT